jgi:hypothetical protein
MPFIFFVTKFICCAASADDVELLSSVGWEVLLDTERDHSSTLVLGACDIS